MQNICFFNSTRFWGGGEKSHFEYATNFRLKGYNVFIITSKGSILEQKAKKNKLDVYTMNMGNFSFLNPRKLKQLTRFFIANRIDTIFLNSSPDMKLGGLAAKKGKVKNIVYMRGLAVPVKNNLLNRYLLTKVVTHPVPNSLDTKKSFLTNLGKILPEERIPVIYRGINFDEWFSRPVSPVNYRDKDEIIIGNVGRLVKQKGQSFLIDLALNLKRNGLNFKIVIAGVGPLEEEIRQLIRKYNLEEQVILAGFFSNIRDFLNSIDIFVFPSLWEGFGNAMVEAMAESKPVVAFNLTSNPEIVTNGINGFLIDYPDKESFTERILMLSESKELRDKIGEKAKESVITRFSFENIINEWEKLLS